ncbi:MAG: hypothetical protein JAY97_12315 [Candidatus Thiodiazotropha sp. 'RUGA']|nr:hypothetical protein [Candidatus Thiodiazotropha sp. 'RUGA']
MASKDDDFDKRKFDALKGNGEESFLEKRNRKKEEELTIKQLERDPNAMATSRRDKKHVEKVVREDIDLLGDGVTYLDPDYDEKYIRGDIDLEGDGITWIDKEYDERLNKPVYEEHIANADYELWVQIALWSAAESAALLLRKDPQIVTPDSIEPYKDRHDFPKKYMRMHLRIDRAVIAGELRSESSLINPVHLLEWAKHNNIDIPIELAKVLEDRSKKQRTESSDTQSNEQKRSEYDEELQEVANHLAQEFRDRTGRKATKEEVASTMIKILDGEHSTNPEIEELFKANARVRKTHKQDSLKTTILRRIRIEW